jgi:hypothetical protein
MSQTASSQFLRWQRELCFIYLENVFYLLPNGCFDAITFFNILGTKFNKTDKNVQNHVSASFGLFFTD